MDRPAALFIADDSRAPTRDDRGIRVHGRMTPPGVGAAVAGDVVIPIGTLRSMSAIIAAEESESLDVVQAVQSAWLGKDAEDGSDGLRDALSSGTLSWEDLRLMMADIAIIASVSAH